jgi:hypothetical protein
MSSESFKKMIKAAFTPFLNGLGFDFQSIHTSGKFYRALFQNKKLSVSITFEPGEEYFDVIVSNLDNALVLVNDTNIDFRFSQLNARYMPRIDKKERLDNELFFAQITTSDNFERMLLERAKELRLTLTLLIAENK